MAESEVSSKRAVVRRAARDLDPITLLATARAGEPVFYLERPDEGEAMVAIGSVAEVRTEGPRRFTEASEAAAELLSSLTLEGESEPSRSAPRLVGGFAFADTIESPLWRDFAPCRLVLPRTQWILADGQWARFDVLGDGPGTARASASDARKPTTPHDTRPERASPPRDESAPEWLSRASSVLAAIESGRFDKVVIARRESRALPGDFDVARVLAQLRAARPSCYTFCVGTRDALFLGSSPEKLVSIRSGEVEADALAGTIARGKTGAEDAALAAALAASDKDLREHALVVEYLLATLRPLVADAVASERPIARAFPEGHHLHTRVRGRRVAARSVLDLVAATHPTPAVCGAPRSQAQTLLGRLEADRGWYSGGVGWVDADGEGSFAVALRAGLLAGGRLTAWAGAGLVAGSDPALELDETALKMRALLGVVGDVAA